MLQIYEIINPLYFNKIKIKALEKLFICKKEFS